MAREAGLTTGAVYSNFRDKEDLFLAAFEQVQALGSDLTVEGTGVEAAVASFRSGAARFENSRQLQVLNLELALLSVRNARVRRFVRQGLADSITAAAADLPGDEAERRELAALLMALANGVALMRMFGPDQITIEAAERGLRRLAGLEG